MTILHSISLSVSLLALLAACVPQIYGATLSGTFINPTPSAAEMRYVTYGAGRYVASGLYETRSAFFTSIDGLQWTELPLDPSFSVRPNGTCYYQLAYNDKDGFLALPASGHAGSLICFILKSSDGVNWFAPRPKISLEIFGSSLVTLPGIFLSAGANRQSPTPWPALFSTDGGITWANSPKGVTYERQTTVIDGEFIMLIDATVAYKSKDGVNWSVFADLSALKAKKGGPISKVTSVFGAKKTGLFAFALSTGRFNPAGSVFRSMDGGQTWNETFYFDSAFSGQFAQAEGQSTTMFLNYVYRQDHWSTDYAQARSDDGGMTWTTISRDDVTVKSAGPSVFILGDDGRLAVSQGAAGPLKSVAEGISTKIDNIVWSSSLGSFIVSSKGGIYSSTSWSMISSPGLQFFQEVVTTSFPAPIYVGQVSVASFNASFDLQKWTSFPNPAYGTSCETKGIAYSREANTWVVPVEWFPPIWGPVPDFYFYTGDGLPSSWVGGNWPKEPRISWPTSIIAARGVFLTIYSGPDGYGVLSSSNGTVWTWASAVKLNPKESRSICRVIAAGESFFAYCMESDTTIYMSKDGAVWTPFKPSNENVLGHLITITFTPASGSSPSFYTYKGRYMWCQVSNDWMQWGQPYAPPNRVTFFDLEAQNPSGNVVVHASSFDNSIFVQS